MQNASSNANNNNCSTINFCYIFSINSYLNSLHLAYYILIKALMYLKSKYFLSAPPQFFVMLPGPVWLLFLSLLLSRTFALIYFFNSSSIFLCIYSISGNIKRIPRLYIARTSRKLTVSSLFNLLCITTGLPSTVCT